MTSKIKSDTAKAMEKPATERKKLLSVWERVDEVTGSPDLENLKFEMGSNKFRILTTPILVRRHWDLPASAEATAVPCAKWIADIEAYITDPDGYLAGLPECPFCEMEKTHGGKGGFYNARDHWVFNVVQDGIVKVADILQRTIMRKIAALENDDDWADRMPNGIGDIEINVKKTSTGPKPQNVGYEVGGVPSSKPLTDGEREEYTEKAVDLVALKMPPATDTDEGKAKWAELLKKAPAPKPGEKPKQPG